MQVRHEPPPRPKTPDEIRREIADRRTRVDLLRAEIAGSDVTSEDRQAKQATINVHVYVIDALRWVLGEDLLWN